MSGSKELLAELRQKVEEAKRKLEEQENALRIVEEMLGASPSPLVEKPVMAQAGAKVKQNKVFAPSSSPSSTGTIIANVAAVLPGFQGQTYLVSDVYKRMQEEGTAPDNKGAISTALRKLTARERIECVVRGKGKAPSVFRN